MTYNFYVNFFFSNLIIFESLSVGIDVGMYNLIHDNIPFKKLKKLIKNN